MEHKLDTFVNSKEFSSFFNVFNSNILLKTHTKKLSEQTMKFIKSNVYYAEVHKIDTLYKNDEIVQFQYNQKYLDLIDFKGDSIYNKVAWQTVIKSICTEDWVQSYIDKFTTQKLKGFLEQCPAIMIDTPEYFSDSMFINDTNGLKKTFNFILGFEEEYVENLGNYKIIYHVIC